MPTPDEIERRITEADTVRSAKRAAAARQVGELAQRRAVIAEQLEDIERQLGDVLAVSQDIIGVGELAAFTDLKPADLTRWLAGRKVTRTKRKKPTAGTSAAKSDPSPEPSTRDTNHARRAPAPSTDVTNRPDQVAAPVPSRR